MAALSMIYMAPLFVSARTVSLEYRMIGFYRLVLPKVERLLDLKWRAQAVVNCLIVGGMAMPFFLLVRQGAKSFEPAYYAAAAIVYVPLLTMLAGLSARAAIQAQTGLEPELKWPNDLLLNGKKIGGILTEMYAEPSAVRLVIIGMGINVNQEKFPPEIANFATSLRNQTGKMNYRLELLVRLLGQFESDYNRFLREGAGFVVERFQSVSSFAKGRRVRVDTGAESYVGTTAGLSPEGLLLVARDNGTVTTVIAGDVSEVC